MKNAIPLPFSRDRGLSLVLVLFAIVALSSLIVLYFSLASNDQAGTAAYTSAIKADDLATGGLELVIEELRKEIADEAKSTLNQSAQGGPTVYLPLTRQDILPERTVSGTSQNLLKTSLHNTPLFTGTGASLIGSLSPSTTPSRNGRAMTLERWNRPALVDFSAASIPPPNWIYLGRQGPLVDPPISSASDPQSSDFVIGRLAFAVYDVGGLLDLNVAGYPAGMPAAEAGKKGSPALARLQALGLSDAQVETIIAFRNPSTRANYKDFLDENEHEGFTKTLPGDNRFLSRQELIRFAKHNGFESELERLTMFSREKNAPSYAPDPALPPLTADPATNGNLAVARHNASGRLLFEKRFPLSKIALLADPGNPANTDEIKSYFGLEYDSSDRTFTYVGPDSSVRSSIKTLSQIGAEAGHRAPDFFETLKAVIYRGSVGQNAGETASLPENQNPGQDDKDFQIIRIGACIIDQYDTDYIPTAINFAPQPGDTPVWGAENLPYVNKLQFIGQNPNPQGIFHVAEGPTRNNHASGSPDYYFRWAVELWNPHVQEYPVPAAPDPNYVPGPNIRVALGPVGGLARVDVYPNATATESPDKKFGTPRPLSVSEHSNEFNVATGYARSTPSIATYYRHFMDPRQVFFGEVNQEPITRDHVYTSAALNILTPVYVDLFVRGPDNFLHHYFRSWKIANGPLKMTGNSNYVSSYMLSDPRTNRMGYFDADWRPNASAGPPNYPSTISVATRYAWPIRISTSLAPNDSVENTDSAPTGQGYAGANIHPGLLYENTQPATQFSDPDGTIRIGDGGFSPADNTQAPTAQLNTNPAANPSPASNPSRPRILDRPFRSVGELGYVFRDAAWKTLNFSGSDSADAALLDAFSLEAPPFTAGKTSANTRHKDVWTALLGGSLRLEDDDTSGLTQAQAEALSESITDFLSEAANEPIANLSEFVTRISTSAHLPESGFGGPSNRAAKAQREAVVRALSGSLQTRTWNLMIDLVAQTGRISNTANSLDQFTVEGERRYWLHVAIDRYTGEILDEQLESVVE